MAKHIKKLSFKALVLCGGADLPKKDKILEDYRTCLEWSLIERAEEIGAPVIGICRGLQLLNLYTGGTLKEHIDNHEGTVHKVINAKEKYFKVNSSHHQCCNKVKGGTILYSSVPDNEIEAVIWEKKKFFGVQWHPEWEFEGKAVSSGTVLFWKHLITNYPWLFEVQKLKESA